LPLRQTLSRPEYHCLCISDPHLLLLLSIFPQLHGLLAIPTGPRTMSAWRSKHQTRVYNETAQHRLAASHGNLPKDLASTTDTLCSGNNDADCDFCRCFGGLHHSGFESPDSDTDQRGNGP